ncbi:MAG TPA: hypothetical protein VHL08_01095 [Dongiaceae bacterium]|jgi:hypothetical protein|nr:hypothetical protein [Dongiaceae bacterium]
MKKILALLLVLVIVAGAAAYFFLRPALAPVPPQPSYVSKIDLPVLPVSILGNGVPKGSLYVQISLLFDSPEKEASVRKNLPVLQDHFLRDLSDIATHRIAAEGDLDPAFFEMRLQSIADDVLGVKATTVRIVNFERRLD